MSDSAPGPVLVTGATGFIGYEVARQLAREGRRPRLRCAARFAARYWRAFRPRSSPPTSVAPTAWPELGLEPLFPTIATGIPAALDECVAFRWVHPVEDPIDW